MESNGWSHGVLLSNAVQHSGNFRADVELQCVVEIDNEYEKNNIGATKEREQRIQQHRSKIKCNAKGM